MFESAVKKMIDCKEIESSNAIKSYRVRRGGPE